MSYNFGQPTSTPSTGGFAFGTPAGGDATKLAGPKPEFSLLGGSATATSSPGGGGGFSFGALGSKGFGSPAGSSTLFGTAASPSFGSPALPSAAPPTFGTPVQQSAAPPAFGTASPSFGSPATLPTFGAANTQGQGGLGLTFGTAASTTLVAPTFGAPAATVAPPAFGNPAQPTAASFPSFFQTTSVGAAAVPAIGAPSQTVAPTFGAPSQSVAPAPTFGTTQAGGTAPLFAFGSPFAKSPSSTSFNLPSFTTATTAAAPPPTLSFNMGGGGGGAAAAAAPVSAAAAAPPPTLAVAGMTAVSQPAAVAAVAPTSAPLAFSLGASTIGATTAPIGTTAAATSGILTGLSHTLTSATSAPAPSLPNFGTTTSSIPATIGTPTTASTAPAPTLSFGPALSGSTTTAATALPSLGTYSLGGGATAATTAAPTTSAVSAIVSAAVGSGGVSVTEGAAKTDTPTSIAVSAVPSTPLTYGQLEDLINKWTIDLENQSKHFSNQARQLNAWDRLLITNGDKILSLNSGIERVKEQQHQLDQELDFVLAQQKELENLIAPLEKELQDTPVTDTDRNHTYQLAENMDSQLKQMSEDLKEIIEMLNESNKNQESTNPINQIGRILNAHMNSLQWIDINTNKISSHLDQITKMHDLNRRNHEINLQKTYD